MAGDIRPFDCAMCDGDGVVSADGRWHADRLASAYAKARTEVARCKQRLHDAWCQQHEGIASLKFWLRLARASQDRTYAAMTAIGAAP